MFVKYNNYGHNQMHFYKKEEKNKSSKFIKYSNMWFKSSLGCILVEVWGILCMVSIPWLLWAVWVKCCCGTWVGAVEPNCRAISFVLLWLE